MDSTSLYPLGSVVRCQGQRFVVVGHRMTRNGANVGPGYLVVPYPLGFVDLGSLLVIPAGSIDELVCAGFVNEEGAQHVAQLGALAHAAADIPYDEYADNVLLLRGLAREGGSHDA